MEVFLNFSYAESPGKDGFGFLFPYICVHCAMEIRFWDIKFRYEISHCALWLGCKILFEIRNDVRS